MKHLNAKSIRWFKSKRTASFLVTNFRIAVAGVTVYTSSCLKQNEIEPIFADFIGFASLINSFFHATDSCTAFVNLTTTLSVENIKRF